MTRFWRQTDIVDGDRLAELPVTVIGAGATGSFITLALAKMGVRQVTVYDDDTVEDHNIPVQFFREQDIGTAKVDALAEIVSTFTGTEITTRPERYVDQPLDGVVIVCVDKMDQRQLIWKQVRYRPQVPLFVDTRMGAEVAVVHTIKPVDPDDVQHYESALYTSDESFQARCTERAIIYTALGIAAITCGKVKKHVMGEPFRRTIVRDFRLSILQ